MTAWMQRNQFYWGHLPNSMQKCMWLNFTQICKDKSCVNFNCVLEKLQLSITSCTSRWLKKKKLPKSWTWMVSSMQRWHIDLQSSFTLAFKFEDVFMWVAACMLSVPGPHCCGDWVWFSSVTIQEGFGTVITMLHYQFGLCWRGQEKLHKNDKSSDMSSRLGKISRRHTGCKVTVILFPWKLH